MPDARPTRVRHRVLALAVCLAFITYLDRVCIAITAPAIMRELSLTPLQMSYVFSAFTLAYGLFEIPTGHWGDRVGTRRVLTRIVVWWSAFTVLTASAWNLLSLLAIRFLFGVGEAGAWPNVARTLSRWFPARERGTAQGIFFMGAHLGGGLTPLMVTALLAWLPWRAVFVVFGSIGFIWAAVWWLWFRDEPHQHPAANAAEVREIESARGAADLPGHGSITRAALRSASVWGLCLMYFAQSYAFMLYITWYPTYLTREKVMPAAWLGLFAGLPLLLSVFADLSGGITTDRLSRRLGLRLGRSLVGGGSLATAGLLLIAGTAAPDPFVAGTLIALAGAASNFLLGAAWGACVDLGGPRAGALSAAMNTSGQVGAFLSPMVFALLTRDGVSWSTPFYLTGLLYLCGAACWLFIRADLPLVEPKPVVARGVGRV